MDLVTKQKWDNAAALFDFMNSYGPEKRWGPFKREFFSAMHGKILFLAVGTGLDIPFFPPDQDIVGIDISSKMLERAQARVDNYQGKIKLHEMDVHDLPFPEGTFDQVFTSCTFCSVPDPVRGLETLKRVLKPGGELRMFEHTGSRYYPFKLLLNMMNPLSKRLGPEVNRDTVSNVRQAGFRVRQVKHIFLDVVKTIVAEAPGKEQ
jgi:ubiquinone/menaquinone biosynthesis C-methylase UbiE